jgi:F0F1-type ATP synthase membrane subunit c/vacuolar-type H+-ATPase subunit K
MKPYIHYIGTLILSIGTIIAVLSSPAHAQEELDILEQQLQAAQFAVAYPPAEDGIVDGDVVIINENEQLVKATESDTESAPRIGVVNENAKIIYHIADNGIPIVLSGQARARALVTDTPIIPGDIIGISPIAGIGQRAVIGAGIIIGTALTGLSQENGTPTSIDTAEGSITAYEGLIGIDVKGTTPNAPAGIASQLTDQLGQALLGNISTPARADRFFRYIVAFLLVLIAIALSFRLFGRNVSTGIEAIGRNPLARRQIQAMIILNIVLIASISIGAIILALAILRL